MNVEQWAANKAVHYNEWANFGKRDFEPVVSAFRELHDCFSVQRLPIVALCDAERNSRNSAVLQKMK
jgi:hypothetical protein